ncbi:hypothetical protein [Luteolibacter sp. Populi]|uniref:hypothetical protein n=1 Tax=Luteolibacter sp. Populi TaxID=3230487 RepID=UPI003467055D
MRLLLFLLFIALPLTACRRPTVIKPPPAPANTLVDGTFISSGGSWFYAEKNTTATLKVDVRGPRVDWNYNYAKRNSSRSSGSSGTGSQMNLRSSSDPWFIYVETPDSLWLFDGVDNLTHAISTRGALTWNQAISLGQLEPDRGRIPPAIIPRLPAELQKLVPPGDAQRKRPSL